MNEAKHELSIRRYEAGDQAAVWNLHVLGMKQVAPSSPVGNALDADLRDINGVYLTNQGEFLVGSLGGTIVAMGALKRLPGEAVAGVYRMRVDPCCQGRGFGRQILNRLEQAAVERGYTTMHLDTLATNARAQCFYERNGYTKISEGLVGVYRMFYYEKKLVIGLNCRNNMSPLQEKLRAQLAGVPGSAHLMGVCGVGVAGVARLLAARGWQVSGCDSAPDGVLAQWLKANGIAVAGGHAAGHVDALASQPVLNACGAQGRAPVILIHTAAVPGDHPEIVRARDAGITVCRRGEALAALVDLSRSVAVCGAHGKTTTTCFTTRLLQELGASPSWCIGGSTATLRGVAGVGGDVFPRMTSGGSTLSLRREASFNDLLVVEADESDGTLAFYHPAVTVLNNIDLDHLEHFEGEAALLDCYRQAVRQTRQGLAFCADDARASEVARDFGGPVLSFGFGETAVLRATQLELTANGIVFQVILRDEELGRIELPVPGRHNALNALGALAAAMLLGHDAHAALALLPRVAELPGRRFERIGMGGKIQVISDYSHHPAEIAALVATARLQGARRVVAVFQPHRYTRTRALGADFPAAFEGVDELVLTPVYAASEAPLASGGIADLYAHFRRLRPALPVLLARSLAEAWSGLRRRLREGDLLLVVGAGDVVQIAGWAAEALRLGAWGEDSPVLFDEERQRQRAALPCDNHATPDPSNGGCRAVVTTIRVLAEALGQLNGVCISVLRPMAGMTFYGVGGSADVVADVATPEALAALLAWTVAHDVPVHLLGQGANTWVSDLGVAGVVVRLRGDAFRGFARQGDEVEVGCGWNGPALLDRLETEGLSGLEFLEGVPGQLGGWLSMNAGAQGGEIGAWVKWMACLNDDGGNSLVTAADAGFGYRRCEALSKRIVWQVALRLRPDTPEAIRNRRQAFRARRLPLAGLRTAGSVFCNPPDKFSGKLLEAAGCKGLRIGGAMVSERHANIVVAAEGATASDVLALLALMRQRVQAQAGVQLALENRMLGMAAGEDGLAMD